MKKIILTVLIFQISFLPLGAKGDDQVITPLTVPPPAEKITAGFPEILAFNLILLTVIYSFYQVFFKKRQFYYDLKTGRCFVLWNKKITELKECPDYIKKVVEKRKKS